MSQLQSLQLKAFNTAQSHGFTDASFGERIALVHSELSEALEEHRNGHANSEIYFGEGGKPEGVPIELADAVIRIMDLCENEGINLEEAIADKMMFNDSRSFRHGGKKL